jgi:hypothetical protein
MMTETRQPVFHTKTGRNPKLPIAGLLVAIASQILAPSLFAMNPVGVVVSGRVVQEEPRNVPILVWAIPLHEQGNGEISPVSKADVYASSLAATKTKTSNGMYSLELPKGHYSLFAFGDLNENGVWEPDGPEPFGWLTDRPSGTFSRLQVVDKDLSHLDFTIKAPRHFPSQPRYEMGGSLVTIRGLKVLQLHGDAKTRGFAHGKLLAPQIIDFFRFYVLEDKLGSAKAYEQGFAKFLHTNFAYPSAYVSECEALIHGMRASGEQLRIPELDRDFSLTDLYAINGYIETRAMVSNCTQFAAWGDFTESTTLQGGMITGRNMDGEIDIRKTTVSHFLLMAVTPQEAGQKRFVSMMWPGFVGTLSGLNEEGFYTMENAGLTGPGAVIDHMVPISWTMRESLAKLSGTETVASVRSFLNRYDNPSGGISGPGCIMLFASPFVGQKEPAFVFEGDRFGDAIRIAGDVYPKIPGALVLSNHHRMYGVNSSSPSEVFGKVPSFSTLWRYQAGASKLEAWHRSGVKIDTAQMRELLQTVAYGTTEHSIITRPNALEFDIAVASMKPELWDAPYQSWTKFSFEELFASPQ